MQCPVKYRLRIYCLDLFALAEVKHVLRALLETQVILLPGEIRRQDLTHNLIFFRIVVVIRARLWYARVVMLTLFQLLVAGYMVHQYFLTLKAHLAVGTLFVSLVAAMLSSKLFYQRFMAKLAQDFAKVVFLRQLLL